MSVTNSESSDAQDRMLGTVPGAALGRGPGCAWPDDPTGLHLDICENGVKHVTWELTRSRPRPRRYCGKPGVGWLSLTIPAGCSACCA